MSGNLKQRILTLESMLAYKAGGVPNAGLIGIFEAIAGRTDADIIGASSRGIIVERKLNETLAELTCRASRELKQQFMFAVYTDGSIAC